MTIIVSQRPGVVAPLMRLLQPQAEVSQSLP